MEEAIERGLIDTEDEDEWGDNHFIRLIEHVAHNAGAMSLKEQIFYNDRLNAMLNDLDDERDREELEARLAEND
jgi:hypothetical protein